MSSTAKKSRPARKPATRARSAAPKKVPRPPKSNVRKARSSQAPKIARKSNGARSTSHGRATARSGRNRQVTRAQPDAELAIINSIQQGLAKRLNFQAIVDLVGDELRELFKTPDLGIVWYDEKTDLVHYLYAYE